MRSSGLFVALLLAWSAPAAAMTISSPDVRDGAPLKVEQAYPRCGGRNISPALSWNGVPKNARSLVLSKPLRSPHIRAGTRAPRLGIPRRAASGARVVRGTGGVGAAGERTGFPEQLWMLAPLWQDAHTKIISRGALRRGTGNFFPVIAAETSSACVSASFVHGRASIRIRAKLAL